jgi:integrase
LATKVAAGIYKEAPGVYDLHVSTGRSVDGKYRKVTRRVRGTLKDAKDERVRMLAAVSTGALKPTETITMAELHERFMAIRTGLSTNTRSNYEYAWSLIAPHIGTRNVKALTSLDLDDAYAQIVKGVSPNTARKSAKHVKALLAQAVRWGLVNVNATEDSRPPRAVPFNPQPQTMEQKLALIDAAWKQERQFGALVYLCASTGMRRGELGGLRWADVDLINATIYVRHQADPDGTLRPTKNRWQRTIHLSAPVVQMLTEHRAFCSEVAPLTDDCFVFSSEPGNRLPFRKDGLTWRWDRLRKTTGINGRLHDLRHSYGTQMHVEGVPPVVAAARMGQTIEVYLNTYCHTDDAEQRKAAEVGLRG